MREIEFRGKREDNGEWVYGFYLEHAAKGDESPWPYIGYFNEGWHKKRIVPNTIGQYIELTDSVGNKIFEGDIVKYEQSTPLIAPVIFDKASFFLAGMPFEYLLNYSFELEVIGNIHDNPELLEEKK
jgi:hypothetical protein